jgi:hypothetical protein
MSEITCEAPKQYPVKASDDLKKVTGFTTSLIKKQTKILSFMKFRMDRAQSHI